MVSMNQQCLIAGQPGRPTIGISGSPPLTSKSRASGPAAAALRLSDSGSVNASHRRVFQSLW